MRCLLVAAAMAVVSARAHAGNPLDKPAFTATPKELLDAAKAAKRGDAPGVVLRHDVELSYDDAGRITKRAHYIVVVDTDDEANEWSEVWAEWRPWRHQKPQVRARVIGATGDVHELDASTLVDEANRTGAARHVRGALAVVPGAVIEEEITMTDSTAAEPGGRGITLPLALSLPVLVSHMTISAPSSLKTKVVPRVLPKTATARHAVSGTRETWTYDAVDVAARTEVYDAPLDVYIDPTITVTQAHDWGAVAKAYGAVVQKKLTMPLPPELHGGDSLEVAQAITTWLHQHVKYSGVDLVEEPPDGANLEQALKRGTGSTNELGMIEVALLRAAGINAELVLVDRGPGRGGDVDAPTYDELDHVLVRATIKGAETWIDPEEPDLPVGQLRTTDQGRTALAITRAVRIETPRAQAAANALHEIRTFDLAEMGSGKVTEVSTETGQLAFSRRSWIRAAGDPAARKQFGEYTKDRYSGELTTFTTSPLDDVAKPFEMTLGIEKATYVDTGWNKISVYLHPRDICDELPWAMRDEEAPERKLDLDVATPFVAELTQRLVIPDGFALPVAEAERKRQLGALTVVETQRLDGRALVVTYRLDVTKTRFTAREVNETRTAVLALAKDAEHFVFEHEGWVLANQGKYREAVAKMTALLAAQPRDALLRARFAQLLITLGDGEGARREGRKAVELAPKDPDVHVALGWILTHDLVGRRWAVGFDREGARKEFATARALGPKHAGAPFELASLLERGTRGRLLGRGADLKAAAEAWRAAHDLDPTKTNAQGMLRSLLWSGDFAGVEAEAAKIRGDDFEAMRVAARAVTKGPDEALRDVTSGDRAKTIAAAGGLLVLVRRYDLAKQLAMKGGAAPPGQLDFISKLQKFDPATKPAADPDSVAYEYFADQIDPGSAGAIYWDAQTQTEAHEAFREIPLPPETTLMTTTVLMDIEHSLGTVSVEGDANAWRILFDANNRKEIVYLAADRGVPKVIGFATTTAALGRHVTRLMGKHDDAARRLLDWIAKDIPMHDLRAVWGDALPKDTVHMTVAAAVLTHDRDQEIAAGTACGMTTAEGQYVCDEMAVRGLSARGKWEELEAFAATWTARAPAAYVADAIAERAIALSELGRFDEAEKIVDDALAAHPDASRLMFIRMSIAAFRGQRDDFAKRADAVAQATQSAVALNNIAWMEYIVGVDAAGALARARKAFELEPKKGFIANTLAGTEQQNGDDKSAVDHTRASIDLRHGDAPGDSDWYVLGRVYEDLGLRDDAIAAYRRIAPPKVPDLLPTPYSLAAARLKILGAPKK